MVFPRKRQQYRRPGAREKENEEKGGNENRKNTKNTSPLIMEHENRFSNPLYKALCAYYNVSFDDCLPVFKPTSYIEDEMWCSIRNVEEVLGEGYNTNVRCRLAEDVVYVQSDAATIKIDLNSEREYNERQFVAVPSAEFTPYTDNPHRKDGDHSFFSHSPEGTKEWLWRWAEPEPTKEVREKQLASYIGNIIPERYGLLGYRLAEVTNPKGETSRHIVRSTMEKYTHPVNVCGNAVGSQDEAAFRYFTSGRGVSACEMGRILGIYSGERVYALCYAEEGLTVIPFTIHFG